MDADIKIKIPSVVASSIFRIQRAEHLNAKHLLILLIPLILVHLQLIVLYQKVNVTSFLETLFAKNYRPI